MTDNEERMANATVAKVAKEREALANQRKISSEPHMESGDAKWRVVIGNDHGNFKVTVEKLSDERGVNPPPEDVIQEMLEADVRASKGKMVFETFADTEELAATQAGEIWHRLLIEVGRMVRSPGD